MNLEIQHSSQYEKELQLNGILVLYDANQYTSIAIMVIISE